MQRVTCRGCWLGPWDSAGTGQLSPQPEAGRGGSSTQAMAVPREGKAAGVTPGPGAPQDLGEVASNPGSAEGERQGPGLRRDPRSGTGGPMCLPSGTLTMGVSPLTLLLEEGCACSRGLFLRMKLCLPAPLKPLKPKEALVPHPGKEACVLVPLWRPDPLPVEFGEAGFLFFPSPPLKAGVALWLAYGPWVANRNLPGASGKACSLLIALNLAVTAGAAAAVL